MLHLSSHYVEPRFIYMLIGIIHKHIYMYVCLHIYVCVYLYVCICMF